VREGIYDKTKEKGRCNENEKKKRGGFLAPNASLWLILI
jgi:hypothetical protein